MFRILVITASLAALSCAAPVSPDAPESEKAAAVSAMFREYSAQFPEVDSVPLDDAERLVAQGDAVFVDVRAPEERAVSMIPGAISTKDFEANKEQYADREIIPYCTIGYRSGAYAERLQEEGYRVRNLEESILGWLHSGRPVVDDGAPVKKVHTYGEKWAIAPDDYEMVH